MGAPLQPGILRRLEQGAAGPLPVIVEFSEWPSDEELTASGLRKEGNVARGRLHPAQIQALARFPQVRSVDYDEKAAPVMTDPWAKIGGKLRSAIDRGSTVEFPVGVTFSERPENIDIEGLSVEGTSGWGRLTQAQILQLCQRADVLQVDSIPEMRPRGER
jgi:hypothetical protein